MHANLYATETATFRDFYGHNRTVGTPDLVDEDGQPIPWFTYPAICYLKQLDFSSCSIFEYGSGNSTLFWAARAKRVQSVDDNGNWVTRLRSRLPSNTVIKLASGDEYIQSSNVGAPHDVIVIDGRWRFDCAIQALRNVNKDGLVLLDNAERYPQITKLFRDAGRLQVDFIGYGPSNWYTWSTSGFFSPTFSVKPKSETQPAYTAGNVDSYEIDPAKFAPFNKAGSY